MLYVFSPPLSLRQSEQMKVTYKMSEIYLLRARIRYIPHHSYFQIKLGLTVHLQQINLTPILLLSLHTSAFGSVLTMLLDLFMNSFIANRTIPLSGIFSQYL